MKKFALLSFLVLCCSVLLQAQRFTYFQCDPLSCQEYQGPVYSGDVGVDGYATCSNYIGNIDVHPAVRAVNCSATVNLAAIVSRTSTTTLGDCDVPVITDGMKGDAGGFYDVALQHPYWKMYQIRDCDGYFDDYVQPQVRC